MKLIILFISLVIAHIRCDDDNEKSRYLKTNENAQRNEIHSRLNSNEKSDQSHGLSSHDVIRDVNGSIDDGSQVSLNQSELQNNSQSDNAESETTALANYRRLLKLKRIDHRKALEIVFALNSYEKRHKMVKLILQKICQIISTAQGKLSEIGYMPGDIFPEKEEVQNTLSLVLENVAFAGDVVLHFPDICHSILIRDKECNLTLAWGISFCNETLIFEATDMLLLSLMAQELNIIERSPEYNNPYKINDESNKNELDKLKDVQKKEKFDKKEHKTKRQAIPRGPRLSKPVHSEL